MCGLIYKALHQSYRVQNENEDIRDMLDLVRRAKMTEKAFLKN